MRVGLVCAAAASGCAGGASELEAAGCSAGCATEASGALGAAPSCWGACAGDVGLPANEPKVESASSPFSRAACTGVKGAGPLWLVSGEKDIRGQCVCEAASGAFAGATKPSCVLSSTSRRVQKSSARRRSAISCSTLRLLSSLSRRDCASCCSKRAMRSSAVR